MKHPHFAITPAIVFALAALSNIAFATTPVVTVTSPSTGAQAWSPVNFAASAGLSPIFFALRLNPGTNRR